VLAVPSAAIQPYTEEETSGAGVMVGDPADPHLIPVRTGISDGYYTEIIDGLSEGDEVLVPGIPMGADDEFGGGSFMGGPPRRRSGGGPR
jgi:hypothetical protein